MARLGIRNLNNMEKFFFFINLGGRSVRTYLASTVEVGSSRLFFLVFLSFLAATECGARNYLKWSRGAIVCLKYLGRIQCLLFAAQHKICSEMLQSRQERKRGILRLEAQRTEVSS